MKQEIAFDKCWVELQPKLSIIKEVCFVTGTNPELDMLLMGKTLNAIEQYFLFDYTHIVYFDLPQGKQILYKAQSTYLDLPARRFIDYFLMLGSVNVESLTYLCTLYSKSESRQFLFKGNTETDEAFDFYVESSFGWALYINQAIELCKQFCGCSDEEAKALIAGLNDRELVAYETASKLKVLDCDFLTFWKKYTIEGTVFTPRTTIANSLYQYLIN